MQMAPDVDPDELVGTKDELSGADIKAVCTEAGLLALRERRMRVRFGSQSQYRGGLQTARSRLYRRRFW